MSKTKPTAPFFQRVADHAFPRQYHNIILDALGYTTIFKYAGVPRLNLVNSFWMSVPR